MLVRAFVYLHSLLILMDRFICCLKRFTLFSEGRFLSTREEIQKKIILNLLGIGTDVLHRRGVKRLVSGATQAAEQSAAAIARLIESPCNGVSRHGAASKVGRATERR